MRIVFATLVLCFALGAVCQSQTSPVSPGLSAPSVQFTGCGALSASNLTVDAKLKSLPISLTECGAKGDTVSFSDGTIAAGSNTLTSSSRSCNGAIDPGKQFMLHGSGASGAPQSGTIASCSGPSFVLSFSAVNATPWSGTWSATVATPQSGAGSYAPGDTLTTTGGSGVIANGVFTVLTTQIVSASVNSGGSGGANGACTVVGTTGAGTKFQASGTVSAGALSGALTIAVAGAYTSNPPSLVAAPVAPVTGCAGLTGATLTTKMGVLAVTNAAPGQFANLPSPNSVTTSGSGTGATLNLVGYQVGGAFTFGTDDTTAVTNAVAVAAVMGKQLYAPQGGYWLASQTTCIPLNGISFSGDGWPSDAFPFTGGSMLLISNSATSAFCGMSNFTFRDLAIYYPAQDSSQILPIAYPPTFESASFLDGSIVHNRFLNSYQLAKVDASGLGSGWGRIFIDGNLGYCIDKCFWWLNGAADTIQLGATNYWGPGGFGPQSIAGPAYLQRYTAASGEFSRIDIGTATYRQVDGFLMTSGVIQGMRYGLRGLSGLIDVSNFTGVNYDAVGSVLSVEGTARMLSTTFSGGEVFSTNLFNPAQSASVWNITSNSNNSNLFINSVFIANSQGHVVSDSAAGLASLTFIGNRIENFGQTTSGPNWGAIYLASSNARISIKNNSVLCTVAGSNGQYFALVQGFENGAIIGNDWTNCYYGIVDTRNSPAGSLLVSGNAAQSTGYAESLFVTGTAATLIDQGNSWDKPAQGALTSGWGTGATQDATSNDNFARITVGTTPSSPAVFTFNFAKPVAPFCTAVDETTPTTVLTAVATVSAVSIYGAKLSTEKVGVSCRYN